MNNNNFNISELISILSKMDKNQLANSLLNVYNNINNEIPDNNKRNAFIAILIALGIVGAGVAIANKKEKNEEK